MAPHTRFLTVPDHPMWGKEKLGPILRKQGFVTSNATVGRIIGALIRRGTVQPVPALIRKVAARTAPRKRPHAIRKPKGVTFEKPGDVVQIDTLSIYPLPGVSIKHFNAYDPFAKWTVARPCKRATAKNAAEFLDAVLKQMPDPVKAIQIDGGSEFMAEFEQACAAKNLPLYVLPPRSPKLNGAVERCNGAWRYEFYACADLPMRIDKIAQMVEAFQHLYNHHRPHAALAGKTPAEYLAIRRANETPRPTCPEPGHQLASQRSDVQNGARSDAVGSRTVLAVDDLATGEFAGRSRPAADGPRDGRSLLRVLFDGSQTDHARHRRHVRRGPRRPAIAAVQRALRRIRISADRRVRRRGPFHHRRASSRQTAQRQGDQALPAPAVARDPSQLAQHRDPAARRQSLLRPRSSRLVSGQRRRLHLRRCADPDLAPARRSPRGQHEGALRGRAERRQDPPPQGIPRRRPKLEPRRADHRPRRGRRRRARHPLRRHQSRQTRCSGALRGYLLPARPGRKPHQVLQDAPGGR